jgi:hypothetical protein
MEPEILTTVTFTPSDNLPITIDLGLDLDFEEKMIQPTIIDFEDEGEIFHNKVEHLNTMFDSLNDSDNDSLQFDSDPDLDLDEFSFSPPSMFQFNASKWNTLNSEAVPKPEIVAITNENNTLDCTQIMYSKSELHNLSKVIKI